LTLCCKQRRDSSVGSGLQSQFVLIATPGSTLSEDTSSKEHLDDEAPLEKLAVEEVPAAEESMPLEEFVVEEIPSAKEIAEEIAVEAALALEELVEEVAEEPEPVSQRSVAIWGISKRDKHKKNQVRFMTTNICSGRIVEETLASELEHGAPSLEGLG